MICSSIGVFIRDTHPLLGMAMASDGMMMMMMMMTVVVVMMMMMMIK